MKPEILIPTNQLSWCDYTDGIFKPTVKWSRMNHKGERFYFTKDYGRKDVAAGITSVIDRAFGPSPFLIEWKLNTPNWKQVLGTMADYGTLCHIGLAYLVKYGRVGKELIECAETFFDKKDQFKRDMLSIKKFLIDYKVKVHFLEGILAKQYDTPYGPVFICSAIDMFATITITEKTKKEVEDGEYVRGEKKGQIKYRTETIVTEVETYAIIDLKSNFNDKEEKGFFESHKFQLLFGQRLIAESFGIPQESISMYNISPLGWKKEPKYVFKKHVNGVNNLGYTDEFLLHNRIQTAIAEGHCSPSGLIQELPEEIELNTDIESDVKLFSYEEMIDRVMQDQI